MLPFQPLIHCRIFVRVLSFCETRVSKLFKDIFTWLEVYPFRPVHTSHVYAHRGPQRYDRWRAFLSLLLERSQRSRASFVVERLTIDLALLTARNTLYWAKTTAFVLVGVLVAVMLVMAVCSLLRSVSAYPSNSPHDGWFCHLRMVFFILKASITT